MNPKLKKTLTLSGKYAVLILVSLVMLFPFYWMVITSLKESTQIFVFPPELFPRKITFGNYVEMFDNMKFFRYMWNSILVSGSNCIGIVVFSGLAAYAFAKVRFPGRDIIFLVFLAGMMVPLEVITVPLYFMLGKFKWVNNLISLIVPAVFGTAGVFGLFILRQFFITVPNELVEAAKVDGANARSTLWYVTIPNLKTSLALCAMLRTIDSFRIFDKVNLLTGGGPANSTTTITQYIYNYGIKTLKFGLGSAGALIMTVIVLILASLYIKNALKTKGI